MSLNKAGAVIKEVLNRAGWDLRRSKNIPQITLLGLKTRPIRTVVDVGANKGQFARRFAEVYPRARFFCFEPLHEPFQELARWSNSRGGRVTTHNVALGSDERTIDMKLHTAHPTSSSILDTTGLQIELYPETKEQKVVQVQQTTLDASLSEEELDDDILVKLDVQGYEDRVIAGGANIFSRASACIAEVSLDSLYQGQARFSTILKLLGDAGLEYAGNLEQMYANDGHCIYLDAMFVRAHSTA
ncbi:MAG: FkbM family methyltransferase [Gammaproteobacteria bacterium]|nr:FkbM family methyltransferase [Gammaproteobacteria bacterium]MDH3768223.1 FkbM family methyltransferase [Gammaproteobacteria bacterium]